jgi:hypothetical protein
MKSIFILGLLVISTLSFANKKAWDATADGTYKTDAPGCNQVTVRVYPKEQEVRFTADVPCIPLTGQDEQDVFECNADLDQCIDTVHSKNGIVFTANRTGKQSFNIEKYRDGKFLGKMKFAP